MRFVIEPHNGTWLAVQDSLSLDHLVQQVVQADVCIADLDDTDALSPARRLAFDDWSLRIFTDKEYWRWLRRAGLRFVQQRPDAESTSWKEYVDMFLQGRQERKAIQRYFTTPTIRSLLFPGVKEFYACLSCPKFYVSRNIKEITEAFGMYLGFQGAFSEVYEKGEFIEQFVKDFPQFQQYVVRGDSAEDGEMLHVLQFLERRKKIEYVIGIYCTAKPSTEHTFSLDVSRANQLLLETLLRCSHECADALLHVPATKPGG